MTEIRHVLFPTDLSRNSQAAFAHARLLAERFGSRVTIYHAVEIPVAVYAREGADDDAGLRARCAEEARRRIARDFACGALPCEVVVRSDVVAPALFVDAALLEFVRARQPDLIVMATHARTGLDRAFMGSVAEQVAHNAGRPVLCARPEAAAATPYRRLLVPTDLSPASRRAFSWAAAIADRFGAEVVAVHVPPRPTLAALGGLAPTPAAPSAESLRTFIGSDLPAGAEVVVAAAGPAWPAIVETAASSRADLIVMSSCGHDSVADRILGSTTDRVLRQAPCAVLVV